MLQACFRKFLSLDFIQKDAVVRFVRAYCVLRNICIDYFLEEQQPEIASLQHEVNKPPDEKRMEKLLNELELMKKKKKKKSLFT